jgi:hypothetical protein
MFKVNKIKFYGYIFSDQGISPDPEKVEAIQKAASPTNVAELRSFLGMTNFVSRFIHDYSTLTEPLRKLTQKGIKWRWTKNEESAFVKLKDALTSDTVMPYYDPNKELELTVDASGVGVAGILSQDNKIIAYSSKALIPVQQRYSQSER